MAKLRTRIIALLESTNKFSELAATLDEQAEIERGLFPKALVHSQFPGEQEGLKKDIQELIADNLVIETESYYIHNPKNRTRPIVTRYAYSKPRIRQNCASISYRMFRKDRLLLWYAAANEELSGSRGERRGLWEILQFFRTKPVQRLWRKHRGWKYWKIPEDAR